FSLINVGKLCTRASRPPVAVPCACRHPARRLPLRRSRGRGRLRTDCLSPLATMCAKLRRASAANDRPRPRRPALHEACFRAPPAAARSPTQPFLAKEGTSITSCHDERFAPGCCRCYQCVQSRQRKAEWTPAAVHEADASCAPSAAAASAATASSARRQRLPRLPRATRALCPALPRVPAGHRKGAHSYKRARRSTPLPGVRATRQALAGPEVHSQAEPALLRRLLRQLLRRTVLPLLPAIHRFTGRQVRLLEDRDWHSQTASTCKAACLPDSLVAAGFLTEGRRLLCHSRCALPAK
uniref:Histone domain-containing protein n=1 Tax=Macrostomum lignano TaxID=282301 RepID=A0A1I8FNA0_9PLAT